MSETLLNCARSRSFEDVRNLEGSESEALEGVEHTRETSGGSINKNSGGISNVSNNDNLAKVLSVVDISYSARLNKLLEHLYNKLDS